MVYILHFDQPLHHARHYVGYSEDVDERLKQHKSGQGARLTQVLNEVGIGYDIAAVYEGDRHFERKLHRCKNTARYCPKCNPSAKVYHPK